MKNLNFLRFATRLTLLLAVVVSMGLSANAQVTVPEGFQYQAIARDASGVPMAGAEISVKFTVDANNLTTPISEEFVNVMTNSQGLFNLVVGGGTTDFDFNGLVNPTVEVEIDLGDGYISMGVVPFKSVPYAEVAGNVAYVANNQLHVGEDVFNVGNFFTGTPGVVEASQAVVVDENKAIEGFGNVGIDGNLQVDGDFVAGEQSIVYINNTDQNNGNDYSGALRVDGGVGIAKDMYVGGNIISSGNIVNEGTLETTDITADDIMATTINVTSGNVVNNLTVGGNLSVAGDLGVTGNLAVAGITASSVTADDFYGNFHGGTLELGTAKAVTVNDIVTTVTDDDNTLVTAGAVYDADEALEGELMVYINQNASEIDFNDIDIQANVDDIASNYELIVTNSDAIQQNRADIADNAQDIQDNADAIQDNEDAIDDLNDFVMDDLDLQHAYDNGNVINIAVNPVDVIATDGLAIKGSSNGTFGTKTGQLGDVNAAVLGTDGSNWGAIAYVDAENNNYAGYFAGKVNVDGDLIVENTGHILSPTTATNINTAAFRVEGGVSIKQNLLVGSTIESNGDITTHGNLTVHLDTDLKGDAIIGTDENDILTVNATSTFGAPVQINNILGVLNNLTVGGDANITGDLSAANITVEDITAEDITASSVTADDFTGNFHGGTLDLGGAKSVTVNDIQTVVNTDSEALVTSLAVYNADEALEGELMVFINENASEIDFNDIDIQANADAIVSNFNLIQTNSSAILDNDEDIQSNFVLIQTNSSAILKNASDIAGHWAFVQDELDLQHAYDNGNEILTDGNPVDVTAETGITVQGTNGDFVGQLAGDNAAVYGSDGTNWAALAYEGVAKDGPYAGYFNGNVHVTNDIVVENAARVQSESTADFSGNGALVVEGGVGIKDNLTVSNSIETHGEVIVGTDLTVKMDTYLEHDATIGTDENDALIVKATAEFEAPVVIDNTLVVEDELTVNADATINGELTVSDVHVTGDLTVDGTTDVQEFTLDGDYGTVSDVMISQGANENPIWLSVEDLLYNLDDGLGIKDFTYDGSAPAVVEANIDNVNDNGTMEFQGDLIAVNEDYEFNWTENHVFEKDVEIEGALHVTSIDNLGLGVIDIMAALDITGDVEIDGDAAVTGDLDVTKDLTASSVETNAVDTDDLTVNNEINFNAETIVALTNSAEVALNYPLAGDDNIPTSGAVTYATNKAIEDRLDVLYFQELYNNAVVSQDLANFEIIANQAPLQIKSNGENGALDVFVSDAAASAIDARIQSGGAADAYVVRGMFEETGLQGALAARYDGKTFGVLGSQNGDPNGIWGAFAYDNGVTKDIYAGYFKGNVRTEGDLNVTNTLTVEPTGLVRVENTLESNDTDDGAVVVAGGVGITGNINVGRTAKIGTSLYVGSVSGGIGSFLTVKAAEATLGNATNSNATFDVYNQTTFENEVTLTDELNLPSLTKAADCGTASDLMISQGADTNPIWINVADLMYDLEDGLGIKDFTYDGSAPKVVEANIDDDLSGNGTMEFYGDLIAVNEDHLFTWTASHVFQSDITVEGTIFATVIENDDSDDLTVNDNLVVNGGLTVSDAVEFTDDLTVGGEFHAQGAATMSSTLDVTDDATFGGNATVDGDFHVDGVTTLSDALTVTGATQINNNLTATGNTVFGTDCANTFEVNAAADFNCLVTASALTVENDATIGGTLHVDGAVTMSDALAVTGNVDIDGNLTALGSEITLGTNSATTLLTVNASSVFNGPVDINGILAIEGLELDDVVLTTVRTDAEGIRPYSNSSALAEDTELVTEKAVASWLPDAKGASQAGRALVLDAAGEINPDATLGAGFSMDMGTGTLDANTVNGATINATTFTSGTGGLTSNGISSFTASVELEDDVTFSGTDNTVTFNSNPVLSNAVVSFADPKIVENRRINKINGADGWSDGDDVEMPNVTANNNKTIVVINNTTGTIDLTDSVATVLFTIPAGEAWQFVSDGTNWYHVQ